MITKLHIAMKFDDIVHDRSLFDSAPLIVTFGHMIMAAILDLLTIYGKKEVFSQIIKYFVYKRVYNVLQTACVIYNNRCNPQDQENQTDLAYM